MPLHRYYESVPTVKKLEKQLLRCGTGTHGIFQNVDSLPGMINSATDHEVRAYFFGRLAGSTPLVRWARVDSESFHPLEQNLIFWRGFIDECGSFSFITSRTGYRYPSLVLEASTPVLRSLIERLADEVGESSWSDHRGKYFLQTIQERLDVRGNAVKSLVELTHGQLQDSMIIDPDLDAIITEILTWSEESARVAAGSDAYAMTKNMLR